MCRYGRKLGIALTCFGAGMLLSLVIGGVFVSVLLGIAALGAGIWLLISGK